MSAGRPLRLHTSVRARLGADRGFLFDERSGRVYSLSSTAAFAVARLQQPGEISEIVAALAKAFDVDAATARRDLGQLMAQLVSEGLATLEDAARDG